MSYILDALRKSEQERAAGSTPVPAHGDATPTQGRGVRRPGPLVAFLLTAAAISVFLYWRSPLSPDSTEVSTAAPAALPREVENRERDLDREFATSPPRQAPAVTAQQPASYLPLANMGQAPYLRELPSDFQQQLPALKIDIHVFTPGAQSILYINSREYHAGEQIQNGLRVEAIVQEGAVLSYNGQLFKLPRPNR